MDLAELLLVDGRLLTFIDLVVTTASTQLYRQSCSSPVFSSQVLPSSFQ